MIMPQSVQEEQEEQEELTSTLPEQCERQVITGKGSKVLRDQPGPYVET